jgi:hypothetical protein
MKKHEGFGPTEEESDPWDLIAENLRPWNSYWTWRDKPIGERGAAQEILREAGCKVDGLISREVGLDPPDCEAIVDGRWTGIEVTELVHRKTLERSLKALKQRAIGKEPERPEAYFIWNKDNLVSELQGHLNLKDRAKLKGGPYERYILVIYSDEMFLDQESVSRFLKEAIFRTDMITDAFLGLSYHSSPDGSHGSCPVFRQPLAPR